MSTRDTPRERPSRPKHDLHCLRCNRGREETSALLLAATATAHLWARGGSHRLESPAARADSEVIYERLRELGRLHEQGVLTDQEFAAKKAELLGRL